MAWKSTDEGMVRPSASATSGAFYAPHAGEGTRILQIKSGSWPNGMKLTSELLL
jgi:hypothetical protein